MGHRYWRIKISGQNSSFNSMSELRLQSYADGANLSRIATMSANSVYGTGYEASKAADGLGNTIWHSNITTEGNGWIAADMGDGNAVDIDFVGITPRNDGYPVNEFTGFELQYSDDGSSYTTAQTVTGITGWANGVEKTWEWGGGSPPHFPQASSSTRTAAFMTFRG